MGDGRDGGARFGLPTKPEAAVAGRFATDDVQAGRAAREALLSAVGAGDPATAVATALFLIESGATRKQIVHRLLMPIQAEAGARWHENAWGVVEERLCTAMCESVLGVLETRDGSRSKQKGHLAVACVEGERHSLPARVFAGDLREDGWEVRFLGADLPAQELRSFLAAHRPDAVLLSATLPANLAGAARCVRAAHDIGVPVLVGGAAFGRDERRADRVGADAWATTASVATGLLREMRSGGIRPRTAGADGDAAHEAHRLEVESPLLADVVAGALSVLAGTDRAIGLAPSIRELLRVVGASLVVDDPQLVFDKVDWLGDHLAGRGESPGLVFSLLSAVSTCLPETFTAPRRTLQSAIDRMASVPADFDATLAAPRRAEPVGVDSPANETARLLALATYVDVRRPAGARTQELVELCATVCQTPVAFVSFIDEDMQRLWAVAGEAPRLIPRGESICARTILQSELIVVPDLAAHPDFAADPLVVGEPRWRFYAGVPLVVRGGLAIGTFAVVDFQPRFLTSTQAGVLNALATEVVSELELDRYRAEQAGDPHRGDQERLSRLLGSVADVGGDKDELTERLLSTREVAQLFSVSTRTVANWAASGRLDSVRTAGGHHRFVLDRVIELLLEHDRADVPIDQLAERYEGGGSPHPGPPARGGGAA